MKSSFASRVFKMVRMPRLLLKWNRMKSLMQSSAMR